MAAFERIIKAIAEKINWVAGFAICGMVVLVCADIIMRLLVQAIYGAFEVTNWLAGLAAAFAVAYIQTQRGHVPVDILVVRLSERGRAIVSSITSPIMVGLSGIITWQCAEFGIYMWRSDEVSQILHFPYHFLLYAVALCFAMLTLVFVAEFIDSVMRAVKK